MPRPRRWKITAMSTGLLLGCWLGMQAVHECGHVAAAWMTGGHVERVVLWPWSFSRTDVAPNPHPLVVVWGGPILGIAIPLVAWELLRRRRSKVLHIARFFAGFCLIANGLYLGFGSLDRIGDAGDMLQLGAPQWTLWLFGAITVPCGLLAWHGQGLKFGLTGHDGP